METQSGRQFYSQTDKMLWRSSFFSGEEVIKLKTDATETAEIVQDEQTEAKVSKGSFTLAATRLRELSF